MNLPRKPNFNAATIFVAKPNLGAANDSLTGDTAFTDTNTTKNRDPIRPWKIGNADVTNLTGRTLSGERIPEGHDETEMQKPLTPSDRKWIEAWIPDSGERRKVDRDVPNQDMMRELPKGEKETTSPLEGVVETKAKLNGTIANSGTSEGAKKGWETKHAEGEAAGPIDPTLHQYAVQESFKKQSAEAVAKSVAKKFNGSSNIFVSGGTPISVTSDHILHSLYKNGAEQVEKNLKTFKPGSEPIALAASAQFFKLNPDKLAFYVNKRLGESSPYKATK